MASLCTNLSKRVAVTLSRPSARSICSSTLPRSRSASQDRYSTMHTFFRSQAGPRTPPSTLALVRTLSSRPFSSKSSLPSSSASSPPSTSSAPCSSPDCPSNVPPSTPPTPPPDPPPSTASTAPHPSRLALFSTYPDSLRRLASGFRHSDPHARPTKSDLLKLSNSFLQRLSIRWKWWTIRGFRKFTADEWSAVASWVLVGHLGWLVLGTTTFFCMVLFTANSLSMQGHVARILSDYFTQGSGITVVFESALVPHFFDSTISLRNVFISRRPKDTYPSRPPSPKSTSSSSIFSILHRNSTSQHSDHDDEDAVAAPIDEEEDTNYSMFDLNVDSIDVTLSFVSWLNGEGLVKRAVVRGVRGVIDRRSVTWDPAEPWIPSEWRHPTQPADGSFHLDSLQVEDMLVTVYQPGDFRPYNVSIFRADIGTFRKKWLFYDFLSAQSITGQYDNCLCSLHKPQRIGKTMYSDEQEGKSKRMARLRIDGLPIDHLQDASAEGPLAWITSGKLDAVCDISFPSHPSDEVDFSSVLTGIIDNANEHFAASPSTVASDAHSSSSEEAALAVEAAAANSAKEGEKRKINPGSRPLGKPALIAPEWLRPFGLGGSNGEEDQTREVVMDIDLRFRDLKAAVPFRTGESLSYVNAALIRPIVAFINANRTLLPIRCRVVQDLSEFDGSWTPFETGLLDATSAQVYSALAHHVSSESANTQRLKAVGVWSLQMTAEMVVGAVRAALLQGRELGAAGSASGLVDDGVQTI